MNYLDVYWSRVNHLGETTAERIRNGGIRSFNKWMAESPHTVTNLSIERGIYFKGIILTSKDKEYEKIMFLNVANNIPLEIGDIMNWPLENGTTEKWIIIQEEKKVNGTYRTFWIIRCNYLLKWIDASGHLQQSWSYFVSSLDSKIKGNYRTWNNLITPQPNKYAEILMPRRKIDRATNFIVEEESWVVIEYDHTSVPGTIYLSLTENKINMIYDDVPNGIADTDKRADYQLLLPPTTQHFSVGEVVVPIYSITKNGIPFSTENTTITSLNPRVIKNDNGILRALKDGEANIQVLVNDCDDIEPQQLIIPIVIDAVETELSVYIEGPDKIHLDRQNKYILKASNGSVVTITSATIDNTTLATCSIDSTETYCLVTANDRNLLNDFTLTLVGTVDGNQYEVTKTITIIPLW